MLYTMLLTTLSLKPLSRSNKGKQLLEEQKKK